MDDVFPPVFALHEVWDSRFGSLPEVASLSLKIPASGANRPAVPDIRGLRLEIHNMDLDDKRLCTVRTDLIGECPGTLDGLCEGHGSCKIEGPQKIVNKFASCFEINHRWVSC